jgi:putative flippase GtrA
MQSVKKIVGEMVRFGLVGLLSYALGAALVYGFKEWAGLPAEGAVALSLAILLVTNFGLNRQFVFRAGGKLPASFARFALTSASMRLAEYVLFLAAYRGLGLDYLVAFTLALVISNGLKFVLYRQLVFKAAGARPSSNPP